MLMIVLGLGPLLSLLAVVLVVEPRSVAELDWLPMVVVLGRSTGLAATVASRAVASRRTDSPWA